VNPDHLFLGTSDDNNKDRHQKGRTVIPALAGEKHPQSKLTDEKVREIRQALGTQQEIAKLFGISQSHVCAIRNHTKRRSF